MREHVRIEQHPAEQHEREGDDEAPRPADRRHPVGEPVAQAGARIRLVGGVAADDGAVVEAGEDAPLLGIECLRRLAQQPQGEVGERDLGHARASCRLGRAAVPYRTR